MHKSFTDAEYEVAKTAVTHHQIASIAWVQRKLRIGYNQAARIMDALQENGVVSAPDPNGRRTVLLKP